MACFNGFFFFFGERQFNKANLGITRGSGHILLEYIPLRSFSKILIMFIGGLSKEENSRS